MTYKKLRRLMEQATSALYDLDTEMCEGGCADISVILQEVARRLGLGPRVRVVAGYAGDPDDYIWHAWVEIDGKRFDPRSWFEGIAYSGYVENMEMLDVFGCEVLEDPQTLNYYAGEVLNTLKLVPTEAPLSEEA